MPHTHPHFFFCPFSVAWNTVICRAECGQGNNFLNYFLIIGCYDITCYTLKRLCLLDPSCFCLALHSDNFSPTSTMRKDCILVKPSESELRRCFTMPAELGRIDLGDVTPHNIKLLRKVNTVVFPVSYHDKFYKVLVFGKVFCRIKNSLSRRMCWKLGSWRSWLTSTILWSGLSAAGLTCRELAGRFVLSNSPKATFYTSCLSCT